MRISAPRLHQWTFDLLQAAGLRPEHAQDAADAFLSTTLRGVGHHDISFLSKRLEWLNREGVNPAPSIQLLTAHGATETWDGDEGLGEVCCTHITRRAIDLAQAHGIGFAAVRRSNHFLAASHYAEMGVAAGCFLMVFSNTDPCMAGPEGGASIIGNDPFGYGMPRQDQAPLIADMCMAYSSLGNLGTLAAQGQPVPEWWGTDRQGRPTHDPQALLDGGSVNPMAHHKGFSLALMVESLTGILANGATGNQVRAGGGINTHNQSVIAFDLAAFGGAAAVATRSADLTGRLREAQPGLRFPGERSQASRANGLAHGIDLPEQLVAALRKWSGQLTVTMPTVEPNLSGAL